VEFPGGFKIGTLSRRTGISSATLRVWEEQYGLLTPPRTAGGQRLYTESDVDRVLYVRELITNHGYSLQAIAGVLDEARQTVPPLVADLLKDADPDPKTRRLVQMAAELRAYLEDAHLRTTIQRDQIREAKLLTNIHATMLRMAQAPSLVEAAVLLVSGSAELIGNQPTTLALYQPADDALRMLVSARSGQVLAAERDPLPVSALVPAAFRTAFREGQPYYLRRIPIDELTPETQRRAAASGVQSLYAHPLTAAAQLVGLLLVTSRRVDGVSPEVRGICARVAAISGPAVACFAASAQATSSRPDDAPA
jgi:DNA-binding transcriptional MerR regulator